MSELKRLDAKSKTGDEPFTLNDDPLTVQLMDFWKWSASDLVSNAMRGILAEFIVATALGIDTKSAVRKEWDPYDLTSPEGIKIEVKSAAYLQSWHQEKHSKICFSIRQSRGWDDSTNTTSEVPARQADIYIFCLLHYKDEKNKIDPLNLDQWEFYAVATNVLNNYSRSQTSITLPSLQHLVGENRAKKTNYEGLKEAVLETEVKDTTFL